MTTGVTALEVHDLAVYAGDRRIVQNVTFDARAGELVAVIGPNGAGKTTLLEAVVGLRPASGRIRVNGHAPTSFGRFAHAFSFLPDAGRLPPETTVDTLIAHANALSSDGPRWISLRESLSIDSLLGQPVGVLSRGEHQRLALYCTLALGRPVAVLDEPFAAFDPLQLRKVLEAVRGVIGERNTVVASIHQLADAESIADRILILAEGRMIAFGDLASLRARARVEAASLEDVFVSLLEEAKHAP